MAETPSENLEQPAAAAPADAPLRRRKRRQLSRASKPSSIGCPSIARGLLQILVPVRVTLASQRKSIQEIIELGPGSIVKFDKTCDEPLELCIGDRPVAQGEVVKVGDKFGLKISGLVK